MSRTYRRSTRNEVYLYFKTEEEFEEAYAASKMDFSEWLSNKPKLQKGFTWHLPNAEEIHKEFREKYSTWIASGDLPSYNNQVRYRKYAKGCSSFEEYVHRENSVARSDGRHSGWSRKVAPSWYCNLYYERPMRREVKRVLKQAYKYDTFDNTVYPEWTNGAAWSYW